MAIGNLQYGTGNNAGNDATSLISTAVPHTLAVENASQGNPAVVGRGTREGHGVAGYSNGCSFPEGCDSGAGVYGENSSVGYGVRGWSASGVGVGGGGGGGSAGVDGGNWSGGDGVDGFSSRRNGVQGVSQSRAASGVYGENMSGGGFGIAGRSNARPGAGAAVLGDNTGGGFAGIFNGAVQVNGILSKAGGGFRIDHPLDPSGMYLNHSFVESPEMMNVYNGNVTSDADGTAVVELPRYFEALNRDFRYQLTVIGQFAQAIVAEEVRDNRFTIRTDEPEVRVSWQVTGVRQDAWANRHRPEAEEAKAEEERGTYLAAEEHGQPASAGLFNLEITAGEAPREQTGTIAPEA